MCSENKKLLSQWERVRRKRVSAAAIFFPYSLLLVKKRSLSTPSSLFPLSSAPLSQPPPSLGVNFESLRTRWTGGCLLLRKRRFPRESVRERERESIKRRLFFFFSASARKKRVTAAIDRRASDASFAGDLSGACAFDGALPSSGETRCGHTPVKTGKCDYNQQEREEFFFFFLFNFLFFNGSCRCLCATDANRHLNLHPPKQEALELAPAAATPPRRRRSSVLPFYGFK